MADQLGLSPYNLLRVDSLQLTDGSIKDIAVSSTLKSDILDEYTTDAGCTIEDTLHRDEDSFPKRLHAGVIDGFGIIDIGTGSVNVQLGTVYLKDATSDTASVMKYDVAASSGISLADNANTWIIVDYVTGTPIIDITLTANDAYENEYTKIELYEIYRSGTDLRITQHFHLFHDSRAIQKWVYDRFGANRTSGLAISDIGGASRHVGVSSGVMWVKWNEFALSAIDTSGADTMFSHYYNGSAWITAEISIWQNDAYNDIASGLVVLTANRYAKYDMFLGSHGILDIIYPQSEHVALASAESALVPSTLPPFLGDHSEYIGSFTFQKNGNVMITISSAYIDPTSFASATDHSSLSNLTNDDHLQYCTLTQSRGSETLDIDTITGSGHTIDMTAAGIMSITPGNSANLSLLGNVTTGDSCFRVSRTALSDGARIKFMTGLVEDWRFDMAGGVTDLVLYNTDLTANVMSFSNATGALSLSSGVPILSFLDDDTFSADSDTALATQQSIKAYYATARLHPSTDGSSHTYINQNVSSTASPTFVDISATDIDCDEIHINSYSGSHMLGVLSSSTDGTPMAVQNDALSVDQILDVMTLITTTTGTAASGIGPAIGFSAENTVGTTTSCARIGSALVDPILAQAKGAIYFEIADNPSLAVIASIERDGFHTTDCSIGPVSTISGSKLTVSGSDSSYSDSSGFSFINDADTYPLVSYLPFSHDNIHLLFDAYFDPAGGAKSSSSNSNFVIQKTGSALGFASEAGIAQGSAATFVTGFSMSSANILTAIPTRANVISSNLLALQIDDSGVIGVASSLAEHKTDILSITDSSFIYDLNPVTYKFKTHHEDPEDRTKQVWVDETSEPQTHIGFIAEEMLEVNPDICVFDDVAIPLEERELNGIRMNFLIPHLVKCIQDLKVSFETFKTEAELQLDSLQAQVTNGIQTTTCKTPCRVASNLNITLSGLQLVDGIGLEVNDRVLIMSQTDSSKNGIYLAAYGTWMRSSDFDTSAKIEGTIIPIKEGDINEDLIFMCVSDGITIDVDDITFTPTG